MSNSLKKSSSSENKDAQNALVATFMLEIKTASGLTHNAIAEQLDPLGAYSLTDVMISQYLSGERPMSKHRMLVFALRARELGWNIPSAEAMLKWDDTYQQDRLDEISEQLKEINKSGKRSINKAEIPSLEKAINALVGSGLDDKTIVGLAILLTQKLIPCEWFVMFAFCFSFFV